MEVHHRSKDLVFLLYLINNIIAFKPTGYKGCYFHIFYTPALSHQFATEVSNTGDVCKDICRSKTFRFAGVRSGECYCGNEVRTAKYTSGCDIACPGRATEKCGGLFRVSMYDVEAEEISTSSSVTETSGTTGGNISSTIVVDSSQMEDKSTPVVTFLLIVAILSIVAVAAFLVIRKYRRLGRTYTVSGNELFKRFFNSSNENYERHVEADSGIPDNIMPAFTDKNKHEANVNDLYTSINKLQNHKNKQVYNHIQNYNKPAVDKTYTPLSTVGGEVKANQIIDTYSHFTTQHTTELVENKDIGRDQSYNTLQATTRSCEGADLKCDITTMYDRTHVFNHDTLKLQVDEYSHANNSNGFK